MTRPWAQGRTAATETGWTVRPVSLARGARRAGRGGADGTDAFVQRLTESGPLELAGVYEASRRASRRGIEAEGVPIEITVPDAPAEPCVMVARHPSGAVTFHLPVERAARRSAKRGRGAQGEAGGAARFEIEDRASGPVAGRRGAASRIVRTFLLKVAGSLAERALPKLAARWEVAAWKKGQRSLGLVRMTRDALDAGLLPALADTAAIASRPERNLLFIHGTFSSAEGAYRSLADTIGSDGRDLLGALEATYGDRVFAFNHFTVSQSPEENARALLQILPAAGATFDVVTHSRGGLVLRELVERKQAFGVLASRFELGRAVLVASPNAGTPLAAANRWDLLMTWTANLLDLLPDNPFTFGFEFVSEALGWFARRILGKLPGLASMDPEGPMITAIQSPSVIPRGAYSALASNYEPEEQIVGRLVDTGVDLFFRMAHDLVVPTAGGWQVDPGQPFAIQADRVGCYGRGGNLATDGAGAVSHHSFFKQGATVDFLVRALKGEPLGLLEILLDKDPPHGFRRRGTAADGDEAPVEPMAAAPAPAATPAEAAKPTASAAATPATPMLPRRRIDFAADEVFHLFVVQHRDLPERPSAESVVEAQEHAFGNHAGALCIGGPEG